MTYPEAVSFLGQARRFGMKLGLDAMQALAGGLGDPQEGLRFIHIAGTNGKGSTAAFCESCLRAAGFRVGLYTSPHLISVRERVQIDRTPISEADFAAGMAAVRDGIERAGLESVTFFEITTALALWYFARERVDWVVWETGLGGRFDATNIVTPVLCIITNIGLEHCQYLGDTLEKIAAEKAGIIKPGVSVVCGVDAPEAAEMIRGTASDRGCPFMLVQRDRKISNGGVRAGRQVARIGGNEYMLGLLGEHQVINAACAVEAMLQLDWLLVRDNWEHVEASTISRDAIARGLAETRWPGRFDVISEGPIIVLDGAHNPMGISALVKTWREFLASRGVAEADGKAHLVFACAADKEIAEMAGWLRPLAREVSLVRLAGDRGADPAALSAHFAEVPFHIYQSMSELRPVWQNAPHGNLFLATGSLFLVGEMLAQQRGVAEEYELNERLEKLPTNAKI